MRRLRALLSAGLPAAPTGAGASTFPETTEHQLLIKRSSMELTT